MLLISHTGNFDFSPVFLATYPRERRGEESLSIHTKKHVTSYLHQHLRQHTTKELSIHHLRKCPPVYGQRNDTQPPSFRTHINLKSIMRAHAACTSFLLPFLLLTVQACRLTPGDVLNIDHEFVPSLKEPKARRQLLVSPLCPEGCMPDGCVQDSTRGGLRCQKCQNNLVVVKTTGLCGELLLLSAWQIFLYGAHGQRSHEA